MKDLDLSGFTVKKGEVFEYIVASYDIRAYPVLIIAPASFEGAELGTVNMPLHMRDEADKQLMAEARIRVDTLCRSFLDSAGRWTARLCSLATAGNNPLTMLEIVRREGWSLSADSRISAWHKAGMSKPFYEFKGGIRETGDRFSFRIFDAALLLDVFHCYENIDYFQDLNTEEA